MKINLLLTIILLGVLSLSLPAQSYSAHPLGIAAKTQDLAVDNNGTIHMVWVGTDNNLNYGRIAIGGSGTYEVTDRQTVGALVVISSTWTRPRMAVRPDGSTVHVVYNMSNTRIMHSWRNSSGVWATEAIRDTALNYAFPSIGVNANGTLHFIAQRWTTTGLSPIVYLKKNVGGSWPSSDTLISATTPEYRDCAMFTDSNGGVHASWHAATKPGYYRYAPPGTGLDQATTLEIPKRSGVQTNCFGDLYVKSNGEAHTAYGAWNSVAGMLTIDHSLRASGGTFQTPTIASIGEVDNDDRDPWPAIVADADRVYVAWAESLSNLTYTQVKLGVKQNSNWIVYDIDPTASVVHNSKVSMVKTDDRIYAVWRSNAFASQQLLVCVLDAAAARAITVASPNGGENWNSGSTHNITWSSTGSITQVDIHYSTNNGGNWTSLASDTVNDGNYEWSVPDTNSANCLLRVSDADNAATNDVSDRIFSISTMGTESISIPSTPVGPSSGNSGISFSFTTGGSTSNLGHTVEYKFDWNDGTDSGWLPVGTTQASHSWAAAGTFNVRAAARCSIDTSVESPSSATRAIAIATAPSNFTISGTITWNGSPLASVTLNGLPGNPVTNSSGVYSATVDVGWSGTATPTRQYYAFTPSSTTYSSVSANRTTNYTATLSKALIVTAPYATSKWERGRTYAITWLKQGAQNAFVKISLFKGTTLVKMLTTKTENDGSFNWLVPTTLAVGTTYKIRVKTVDDKIADDSDTFSVIVPTITVTAPTTGTVWVKNVTKAITWTTLGTQDANVKIQLYQGTTKKLDIILSTPNDNTYNWTIPSSLVKGLYTVRITTLDGKVKGTSKEFTIAIGLIKVIQPAAKARLVRGTPMTVSWTSEGVVNANVKILLYKGTTLNTTITTTTPNDGSFTWTIPATQKLGTDYKVRVAAVDGLVLGNSGLFTVADIAGLTLTSPNGAENLQPVAIQPIRWSDNPDVLEVKLEFSRDNGGSFTTIADHVANTGKYDWIVPVNFTRNGIIRVSDASGRPWSEDGLLEYNFKFMYGGEGDEPGAVLWFGGSDPKDPGYGFAKLAIGRAQVQFGGLSKAIEPLGGGWHELRVRFDLRRDSAEIRLDNQPLFENAGLNTTRDHYFQPQLVLQAGGEQALDFILDDLSINVVQIDSQGGEPQTFSVLNDDFNRYDDKANALQSCWQWLAPNVKENRVELSVENPGNKTLRLRTQTGMRRLVCLPYSLPEKVLFDISDKCFTIDNNR